MADAQRRLGGPPASVNATSRGRENFTERDFLAGYILRFQLIQIGTDEASKE
jgi:hypothetical protein